LISFSWALLADVAAFREAFGSHHRQRDVMADVRDGFGVEEVGSRCLEELHGCRVLERRGVRHVDDDSSSVECFGQALASECVHARVW
jgi:hypothetical protein